MSDPYHIPLGIEAVSCSDPSNPPLFDEMRAAIYQGQRDSALIRNCLNQADYRGWSGEDRYVMLAYHALVMLETLHKRELSILQRLAPVTMPLSQLLKSGRSYTEWVQGSPTAPGSYVVEYDSGDIETRRPVAGSDFLTYPERYNVKRHFRFYP